MIDDYQSMLGSCSAGGNPPTKRNGIVRMGLAILAGLALVSATRSDISEAAQARQLLRDSLAQIDVPGPGQVVRYSYTLLQRTPAADREQRDPYHLPYSDGRPALQYEDTWVEIDAQGYTARWRTQLRNARGELLQDLMFDGRIETDYYLTEGRASRHREAMRVFKDNRVALVAGLLDDETLSRREGLTDDGRPVLMVYTAAHALDRPPSVGVALLTFARPFMADLQPVSTANRVDFDRSALVPVGIASVVWDSAGTEHEVSYRKFSEVSSIPSNMVEAIFEQFVPAEAFGAD